MGERDFNKMTEIPSRNTAESVISKEIELDLPIKEMLD